MEKDVYILRRDDFPAKLKDERVEPKIEKLWCRGKWDSEIFNKCCAIVGSRRMSRYGRQVIEEIVPRLCGAGYTIVSGLMYGVDQVAHKQTLACGGRAIAVLGYGISRKNEKEADKLANEIEISNGLILSEYPGETRGQVWTFPQRNRIVVGISDFVIVVEAGIKSGSLNTANWAKRMNKPIYAVPGSIFGTVSEGTNELIKQGLAKPLTLNAITELVGGGKMGERVNKSNVVLGAGEREIYSRLELLGPQSANELARGNNLEVREVLAQLAQLEMKGVAMEERSLWKLV